MALVKYGAGIIQMSGSVAGSTFARNRYGNYVRARTVPTNPNTALQQKVRNSMAFLTSRWSQTLTPVQRTAWGLYASNVVMKNRLGEACYHSGFNHYIRSNMVLEQSNLKLADNGPVIFELPAQDPTFAIAASEIDERIEIFFDNTMDWANETGAYFVVFQGMPQNAQRNFFAGPWRLLGHINGDDLGAPTSPVEAPVVFYNTQGQRQWVYARIVRDDGRLSESFRADCIVGA